MNSCHASIAGVKGDFVYGGIVYTLGFSLKSQFCCGNHQRPFGWVAHNIPVICVLLQNGCIAQQTGAQHQRKSCICLCGDLPTGFAEFPFWFITDAADVNGLLCQIHLAHGHLVLGKCASLVGTDDVSRAKCFHCG